MDGTVQMSLYNKCLGTLLNVVLYSFIYACNKVDLHSDYSLLRICCCFLLVVIFACRSQTQQLETVTRQSRSILTLHSHTSGEVAHTGCYTIMHSVSFNSVITALFNNIRTLNFNADYGNNLHFLLLSIIVLATTRSLEGGREGLKNMHEIAGPLSHEPTKFNGLSSHKSPVAQW